MRDSSVEVGGSSSLVQRLGQLVGLCAVAVLLSGCSLWGWGENRYGDLGLGETRAEFQSEPVRVSDDLGKVSLGTYHACGIDSNQYLYCWGANSLPYRSSSVVDGSLGVGDLENRQVPTRVGADRWLEVDTRGEGGTCGIKVDGTLWCWGDGVLEPAPLGSAVWRTVEVFYSGDAACGIQADSSLWCWGDPFAAGGEKIGDGWQTLVGARRSVIEDGVCGLRDDGLRWCFDAEQGAPYQADSFQWADVAGLNRPDRPEPSSPYLGDVPDSQDCGIQTDSSLWCDVDGELAQYPFGLWQSVDGTERRSCGVQIDGTLWCFDEFPAAPVQVGGDTDWVDAFVGWMKYLSSIGGNSRLIADEYQCATKTDGSLWCWGSDKNDRLGDDGPMDRPDPTPIGNIDWAQIAAGSGATCGIDTSDSLWCWGTVYPIGLGSDSSGPVTATEPTKIGDAQWIDIDVSVADTRSALGNEGGHACGVQIDGSLWCWGQPFSGELGVPGPIENAGVPNRVAGSDWAQVATGVDHTCAIKTDGSLWCWGAHFSGQLGIGFTNVQWEPVLVSNAPWKQVSAGGNFTCGIQADDSLWCWGTNMFRTVLGDPTLVTNGRDVSLVPARIGSASWDSVSLGALHTCGLQTDSSLWCWGYNTSGEVGVDQEAELFVQVPTRIGAETWSSVDAGGNHTCGIQSGGTLWCWGKNANGQLGLGSVDSVSSPQQVGTGTDWITVSAGGKRTMALR